MALSKITQKDAQALKHWWEWLSENRGDRANLRRVHAVDEALLSPAFARFLKMMPGCWLKGETGKGVKLNMYEIALVAAVLARVKSEPAKEQSFAKSLATPKEGSSKSVMSELRFQQLQKSRTPDEFFMRICRAVNLLGGRVSVESLADDIVHWLVEYRFGPASKPQHRLAVRWAQDYYQNFKD